MPRALANRGFYANVHLVLSQQNITYNYSLYALSNEPCAAQPGGPPMDTSQPLTGTRSEVVPINHHMGQFYPYETQHH